MIMSKSKFTTTSLENLATPEDKAAAIEAVKFLLDQGNPEEYDERIEDMFEACIHSEVIRQGHKLPEIYYLRNMLHDFFATINRLRIEAIHEVYNAKN